MTPSERRALFFLAAVLVLGGATKLVRAGRAGAELSAADSAALARQIAAVDSARSNTGGRTRGSGPGRPPGRSAKASRVARDAPRTKGVTGTEITAPEELRVPLDLDRASGAQIESLPGVGPVLAARIVADRLEHGSFGSFDALMSVRGIGPAMRRKLEPLVTFSGPLRPPSATPNGALPRATSRRARAGNRSSPSSRESGPDPTPTRIRGIGAPGSRPP
jgi:competence protein ComEA